MEVVITDLFESIQTITVSIFHSVNMGITRVKLRWRSNKHLSLGKKPEEWTFFSRLSASHLAMCSPRSVKWWDGLNSANQSMCRLDSLLSFSFICVWVVNWVIIIQLKIIVVHHVLTKGIVGNWKWEGVGWFTIEELYTWLVMFA